MSAQHCLHDCAVVKFKVVLFQYGKAFARSHGHSARCGRQLSREHAHQGGFACAVSPYYTVAVAAVECEVHVLEKHALAKLDTEVIGLNHLVLSEF